jgi:hypothetical protein
MVPKSVGSRAELFGGQKEGAINQCASLFAYR